jgi:tetratricopeptide (TPR) repeat protein
VSVANVVDSSAADPVGARYRLGERLGAGASGETFAATDTNTGAACVVKLFAAGAGGRRVALAELRGLETLSHPNVARLRDAGRLPDGRVYLVTDRIVGPGLEAIATVADEGERRARFSRAAVDLVTALAQLHARGIVHGDVCPANVRLATEAGAPGRAVLIDFGLAGPPRSGDGGARGTLGYAAPEALTGARTPAVDLHALGATLFEAWSGATPFGRGLAAAQRMLGGPAPALSSVRAGLGPGWDELVARLLAADPAERPPSARVVLREVLRLGADAATPTELDLAVPYPEGDPLAGILVGRRAERAAMRAALERLGEGAASVAALALVGAPGSGRSTLFEASAREAAVAAAAGTAAVIDLWRGDAASLPAFLGVAAAPGDEDPRRAAETRLAVLAEAIEARARTRPLCLFLEEGEAALALATFMAGAAPSGRSLIVVPARAPIARPFAGEIVLPPLDVGEIRELVGAGLDGPAPEAAVSVVAETSRGNAALAALLARQVIANVRAGLPEAPIAAGGDLATLLAESFAALAEGAQRFVLALALGVADPGEIAGLDAPAASRALAAARAAGWIAGGGEALALPSSAHARAALATVASSPAVVVAERALGVLAPDDLRRADALAVAGRPGEAAEILRAAGTAAAGGGDHARAASLLERAAALAPASLTFADRLALATGLGVLGRYPEAGEVLAQAAGVAATGEQRVLACEREAWLLGRRGDAAGARAVLERGLAEAEGTGLLAPSLRARLGRLLVSAGRFAEALAIVDPALPAGESGVSERRTAALAVETALLASAYLGDLPQARARLTELGRRALGETRLAYLEGLLAQLGGDEAAAREAYARAYETAAAQHDVHTVAAVAVNLAGLLVEQGLYGEALAASARAVRELGRLGATTELVPALVNAANLFVEVGDLPAARRALDRAAALGSGATPPLSWKAIWRAGGVTGRRPWAITGGARPDSRRAPSRPPRRARCRRWPRSWRRPAGSPKLGRRWARRNGCVAGPSPWRPSSHGRVRCWRWPREVVTHRPRGPPSWSGRRGKRARGGGGRRPGAWRRWRAASGSGAAPRPTRAAPSISRAPFSRRSVWRRPNIIVHPWRAIRRRCGCGATGCPDRAESWAPAPRPPRPGCGASCASTSGSTASCGCHASWRRSWTPSSS